MATIYSRIYIEMTNEADYGLIETIVKLFDKENTIPIEEYVKENYRITSEEILADEDDVVFLLKNQ